jgi:Tol biopolymer transport system component
MGKWAALLLLLLLMALSLAACVPESSCAVTFVADGETRTVTTDALTVRDLLAEVGVVLDEDDRVVPTEPTLIEDGMTVRVIRVEVRTETGQREIPFERTTVRDASVPAGETRLLEPGVTGVEETTYRVTFEDGVEVERQMVRRATLQEPRTEVILVGAQAEITSVPISGTVAYIANQNAWVMQTTSRNQRRLTHTGDLDGRVFALSPDGSYLLFTRVGSPTVTSEMEAVSPSPASEEGDVGTATPDGEDEGADIGRASADIAGASGEAVPLNTLWMIETAAVTAEPVRVDATGVLWADWEPECRVNPENVGCRIAYSTGSPAEGNPAWKAENDLWIARLRGRDGRLLSQRCVVEPSAGGSYGWWGTVYAWSPDGRYLAYARADQVGVVRAYDGVDTSLARFPPFRTYAPWVWTPTVSWSPEGQFIVTTLHGPAPTGEDPEDSPVFDVHAIAADGTLTVKLVSEAGMWAAPAYAPAGDLLVFGRARSPYASQTSGYELYLMDRDGSDRHQLFPPEEEMGLEYPEVVWGPGGDCLAIVYQGNLYLVDVAGGGVSQLTDEGGVTTARWRW